MEKSQLHNLKIKLENLRTILVRISRDVLGIALRGSRTCLKSFYALVDLKTIISRPRASYRPLIKS